MTRLDAVSGPDPAGTGARSVDTGERIIAHLAFARAVAARSLDPRCRGADREDLIAWGVLGLVQAARRYRGNLGAPFGAYAARRVRGQVLDALRDRDPLTRAERRAFREQQKLSEDVPPPYVEISLERLAELGDADVIPLTVRARRHDPRWAGVVHALRSLAPLERRVIVLAYGNQLTLREIGERVGLSESGVCRMRARALRKLRAVAATARDAPEEAQSDAA